MTKTCDYEKVEVASATALRDWLASNHAREDSVWLVTWMKATPARYISREEVLDELIAYGWIDGVRRKLDDARTMQLISRRKVQWWSKSYKDRAARLIETGRMAQPGRASIAAGKRSGLWTFMDDVDALIAPRDLEAALSLSEATAANFAKYPDAYKRNVLRWLKLAKTDATREKRLAKIVETSAANGRIPQM